MTELAGVDADRVSMASWMLCERPRRPRRACSLAPLFAAVSEHQLHDARRRRDRRRRCSAALTSIPVAFAGGLGARRRRSRSSTRYLPTNSVLASNLRPALPFVVLFLVLIFSPALRNRRELADPLAGVDPPPPAAGRGDAQPLRSRTATRVARRGRRARRRLLRLLPRRRRTGSTSRSRRRSSRSIFLLDHRDHRHGGRDLACARRRSRPSARCATAQLVDPRRHVGARRDASSARVVAAAGRCAARDPGAAPRRHLPVARDARVRVVLRERHGEARAGSAAARSP